MRIALASVLAALCLSAAAGQDFTDLSEHAVHASATRGPFCWKRGADALADAVGIPERVCVDRFQLFSSRASASIVVAGSPISGGFTMTRAPLLDSYHRWHPVWQAEAFSSVKTHVANYEKATGRLKFVVAIGRKGRPAEDPELDGDIDIEYKLPNGELSRWSYLVAFNRD